MHYNNGKRQPNSQSTKLNYDWLCGTSSLYIENLSSYYMDVIWKKSPQHELINSLKSGNFKRIFFHKNLLYELPWIFIYFVIRVQKFAQKKQTLVQIIVLVWNYFRVLKINNHIKCFYFEPESMIWW